MKLCLLRRIYSIGMLLSLQYVVVATELEDSSHSLRMSKD